MNQQTAPCNIHIFPYVNHIDLLQKKDWWNKYEYNLYPFLYTNHNYCLYWTFLSLFFILCSLPLFCSASFASILRSTFLFASLCPLKVHLPCTNSTLLLYYLSPCCRVICFYKCKMHPKLWKSWRWKSFSIFVKFKVYLSN